MSELERREFWAALYYLLVRDEGRDSDELIEPVFGLGAKAVEEYYQHVLVRPEDEATPLWLDLVPGARIGIEHAACGDASDEVRFLVSRDAWEGPELLGYDSPHFALPAFRWEELEAIHRIVAPADRVRGAAAALLLFPSVYVTPDEATPRIHEQLVSWWRELGVVRPESVELLASSSAAHLTHPEVRWHLDGKLGWINDSPYSFRNPGTRMCRYEESRFQRVREFMAQFEG